ncbi:na-ca exchanger/integrin-beta4 [Caudoviricetes sp.]|nr:MAG: Na-Ca exchanger-like protein [Podoviridae sp. ct2cs2]UOF77504.1 na-ca exchanger/integrin-beta4 [Caudoviricetes sp.]
MAFYLNGNRLAEGVGFTDAKENKYPPQWLNTSTEEEKAAIGITWVADPVRADDRFWWNGDINNPKALEDRLEVKEDGTPLYKQVYDEATESMVDTTEQVVTKGLKSQFVAQIKDTAGKLLASTDWYIIRKAERNVDIPAEIALKRTQIVTEANRLETDINASTTVEALIEVLNAQNWGE